MTLYSLVSNFYKLFFNVVCQDFNLFIILWWPFSHHWFEILANKTHRLVKEGSMCTKLFSNGSRMCLRLHLIKDDQIFPLVFHYTRTRKILFKLLECRPVIWAMPVIKPSKGKIIFVRKNNQERQFRLLI